MNPKTTLILHPKLAGSKPAGSANQPIAKNTAAPTAADTFLSVKEAAFFLHVSKSFMDKLRVAGGGPEFIRLGARKVLYRRQDLENWARSRRFESTSQYPTAK